MLYFSSDSYFVDPRRLVRVRDRTRHINVVKDSVVVPIHIVVVSAFTYENVNGFGLWFVKCITRPCVIRFPRRHEVVGRQPLGNSTLSILPTRHIVLAARGKPNAQTKHQQTF